MTTATEPKTFLITGGAGFIGSAVIRELINQTPHCVINVDKLTYAGNLDSLAEVAENERYTFIHADICDGGRMRSVFQQHQPDILMHLAAESHVDRSIDGPDDFIRTNIMGTYALLETSRRYLADFRSANSEKSRAFRFHHISTDEVYGDLHGSDDLFTEMTSYAPSSPYSASKASSDHLVRAWGRTFGIPVVITNCSNNYGPYHFPEKLIPLMILNALEGKPLPVYGDGQQVRDWLYVEDHARALVLVAQQGENGQTYNIGGHNEKTNLEVVHRICDLLDERVGKLSNGRSRRDLIEFVQDRPGHDVRYAIDAGKIQRELGWTPAETFDTGLARTVDWYLENRTWWQRVRDGSYHGQRLGTGT